MKGPLLFAAALLTLAALTGSRSIAADGVAAPAVRPVESASVIVQARDSGIAALTLSVPAGRDRQASNENGLAALVAQSIVQTPVDGAPLQAQLEKNGAAITYTVGASDVRFYVEGLSTQFASTIVPFVARALGQPDFSSSNLSAARAVLGEKIAENERLPLAVGIEMLDRTFYVNSNAGLPAYGIPQTLATFAPADADQFFAAHYRRTGAIASAIGPPAVLSDVVLARLIDALRSGTSSPSRVTIAPLSGSSRELVTHRDLSVPWLVAQYPAPAMRSTQFGAMLVLSSFVARTLQDVTQLPGITSRTLAARGAGTIYDYDSSAANVLVYIDGGLGDPTRAFATALAVVNIFAGSNVGGDAAPMRAYARGDFFNSAVSLEERTRLPIVFYEHSGSADYVARATAAIQAVSLNEVQRVARAYLQSPTVALVLPRSTSLNQTE